tara:strand:- start:899 stop:1699 length:801 start_codon:yes stop_codon:yes gene_type:complete
MSELYNRIEELVFELEDDFPSEGRTLAIVPGAFRPPHLGHLNMVEQYSNKVDEVVVLVSSNLKGNRVIGENVITAQQSRQIWEELLSDRGLRNVRIEMSKQPTKASAMLEYIGDDGPLGYGTRVIFGISSNNNSLKRYESLGKYAKRGVSVLPVLENAAEPVNMNSGEPYKSSDIRQILDEGGNADIFFGEGRTEAVRSILGFNSPIEEMSAMGGGAVAGFTVDKEKNKRKPLRREQNKKTKHPPYNELYLYKEVLKLLKKKGIIK